MVDVNSVVRTSPVLAMVDVNSVVRTSPVLAMVDVNSVIRTVHTSCHPARYWTTREPINHTPASDRFYPIAITSSNGLFKSHSNDMQRSGNTILAWVGQQ